MIVGVRTLAQLEDNLGSVGWQLGPLERDLLDRVSALELDYPYRMLDQNSPR